MTLQRLRRGLLAAALLATAAACSGDDGADAGAADDPTTTAGTTTVPADGAGDPVVWPGDDWERADAASLGFDPEAMEAIATDAEALDSECLVVTRRGRIVGEWYWDEVEPTTTREVFSVTKSITSTLVGIAQDEGHLSIDDPASDYIDEWQGTESEAVTVRNLLSNDSGREWNLALDYLQLIREEDRDAFAIGLGQQYPPGESWAYNNSAIQTLDRVLTTATGEVSLDFAAERLFGPIGMDHSEMTTDVSGGSTNMFMGLSSTCEDLARFGYLFLRDGAWDGEQVVSAEWVEEATGAPSQELNAAYGFLWWLNVEGRLADPIQAVEPSADPETIVEGQLVPGAPEDMFSAQGLGGQVVLVDPGSETVVVRIGKGGIGPSTEGGYRVNEAARMVTEALTDP